jgi:hypothetical protein
MPSAAVLMRSTVDRRSNPMLGSFMLGMMAGAAFVWFYELRVREILDAKTRAARARAAATLGRAASGLEAVKERIEGVCSRSEERS